MPRDALSGGGRVHPASEGLTGHKIKTMSYGVYSSGPDLARLAEVVERIEYKEWHRKNIE